MRSYFVYIITNFKNTVLYTGITDNLERRIFEHKNGVNVTSFSNKYKLSKLIWYEEFSDPNQAIEVEKKIKGWLRIKKINLIEEKNPDFNDLGVNF